MRKKSKGRKGGRETSHKNFQQLLEEKQREEQSEQPEARERRPRRGERPTNWLAAWARSLGTGSRSSPLPKSLAEQERRT